MPVIGLDCRFGSTLSGLGTFTRHLAKELLLLDDHLSYVLFVKSASESWLEELSQKKNCRILEAPYRHYSFSEQTDFPNVIQDAGCDLFHSPHFNVPFFCPVPFTCTVHDLILHRFPNEAGLLKRIAYRCIMRNSLKKSQHIFAVSQSTKTELCSYYGHRIEAKTTVTYPGVSRNFQAQTSIQQEVVRVTYRLEQPFLLYVGNCKSHKNVAMLVEAFHRAELSGVELVLIGSGHECAAFGRHSTVRMLQSVPEDHLPALYSASLGCITATRMEGFCLPLIEAMACNTPVLATNVGPIPEVCNEHALFVEPTVLSIANGLRMLVLDSSVRTTEKLAAAKQWSERFSWSLTAAQTANVFHSILEPMGHK